MSTRAQDMTSRQYKGLLTKIHNTGAQLDKLVSQGIAYCAYHHIAHGNKAPWDALLDAAPQFARKIIRDARKACEGADKANVETVLPEVESAAVESLGERRQKGAPKKEAAAPKADTFKLEARTVEHGVETIALTNEEYQAALEAVHALRKANEPDAAEMDTAKKAEKLGMVSKRKTA